MRLVRKVGKEEISDKIRPFNNTSADYTARVLYTLATDKNSFQVEKRVYRNLVASARYGFHSIVLDYLSPTGYFQITLPYLREIYYIQLTLSFS